MSSHLPYKNITVSKVFEKDHEPRRTKIFCTIGPASDNVETLASLIENGMNVCRLNFSHGDHQSKHDTLKRIKEASERFPEDRPGLLLDTKGPEIRTGFLENPDGVILQKDSHVEIVTDYDFKGNENTFACSYEKLPQSVKLGDTILAADGSLVMEVVEIHSNSVVVKMMSTGKLGERKNMNLPGNKVDLPVITPRDEQDIKEFAGDVDFIAVSFVQKGSDIDMIRKALGKKGRHVKTIAKIENQEGLTNFEDILENFDGIMVARGDLGMEIPIEKVFMAQKMIIRRCNIVGKPVIVATQMLESMTSSPRPTRAEATDVANAVLDGADCVMLSGETASGNFPIKAVSTMSAICCQAELSIDYQALNQALVASIQSELGPPEDFSSASSTYSEVSKRLIPKITLQKMKEAVPAKIAADIVRSQIFHDAKVIIVASDNSESAKMIAKFRPGSVVLFMTHLPQIARQVSGLWSSVYSVVVPKGTSIHKMDEVGVEYARKRKWIKGGDAYVVVRKTGKHGGQLKYTFQVEGNK